MVRGATGPWAVVREPLGRSVGGHWAMGCPAEAEMGISSAARLHTFSWLLSGPNWDYSTN